MVVIELCLSTFRPQIIWQEECILQWYCIFSFLILVIQRTCFVSVEYHRSYKCNFKFIDNHCRTSIFRSRSTSISSSMIFSPRSIVYHIDSIAREVIVIFFSILVMSIGFLVASTIQSVNIFIEAYYSTHFDLLQILSVSSIDPSTSCVCCLQGDIPLIVFTLIQTDTGIVTVSYLSPILIMSLTLIRIIVDQIEFVIQYCNHFISCRSIKVIVSTVSNEVRIIYPVQLGLFRSNHIRILHIDSISNMDVR